MQPMNNKSLLHFVFGQMEKLDKKEISVDEAKAQANLAKQANNALKYELDRVNTLIALSTHNRDYSDDIQMRNAEGKLFDNGESQN